MTTLEARALSLGRGSGLVASACEYAIDAHAGDERSDGTPFALHPLEAAALLDALGADEEVVAAGALHDVLEKTGASRAELERRFGARVARAVAAVSEDESIADAGERKAALRAQVERAGADAQLVFAADKLSKAIELRARVACDPSVRPDRDDAGRKAAHYGESLATLERTLGDHPLVRLLRFQLETLGHLAG